MTTLTIPNGGAGYVLVSNSNTLQYRWSTSGTTDSSWVPLSQMDLPYESHDIEVEFDDN